LSHENKILVSRKYVCVFIVPDAAIEPTFRIQRWAEVLKSWSACWHKKRTIDLRQGKGEAGLEVNEEKYDNCCA
jgi:hypothetical protein